MWLENPISSLRLTIAVYIFIHSCLEEMDLHGHVLKNLLSIVGSWSVLSFFDVFVLLKCRRAPVLDQDPIMLGGVQIQNTFTFTSPLKLAGTAIYYQHVLPVPSFPIFRVHSRLFQFAILYGTVSWQLSPAGASRAFPGPSSEEVHSTLLQGQS